MKVFTLKIEELFKMDTGKNYPEGNFNSNKRRLIIPMYQREFKWSNEKI